jgi:hypothetical protein
MYFIMATRRRKTRKAKRTRRRGGAFTPSKKRSTDLLHEQSLRPSLSASGLQKYRKKNLFYNWLVNLDNISDRYNYIKNLFETSEPNELLGRIKHMASNEDVKREMAVLVLVVNGIEIDPIKEPDESQINALSTLSSNLDNPKLRNELIELLYNNKNKTEFLLTEGTDKDKADRYATAINLAIQFDAGPFLKKPTVETINVVLAFISGASFPNM